MIAPARAALGKLAAVLWTLGLTAADGVAAAEEVEHPPIYLKLDPCVPVQEAMVRQVLSGEFGALSMQGAAPSSGATRVSVDCADMQISLRADDPLSGKSLLRRLDLWMVDPSIRERLLGLAIAELVSVSWT